MHYNKKKKTIRPYKFVTIKFFFFFAESDTIYNCGFFKKKYLDNLSRICLKHNSIEKLKSKGTTKKHKKQIKEGIYRNKYLYNFEMNNNKG